MRNVFSVVGIALIAMLTGCMPTAAEHAGSLQSSNERETTVGIVQKEIRKGMPSAEVAQALGSPNIVSKDKSGVETWIYDKIATEVSYSASRGGLETLFIGPRASGAASQTQKTLTVVIKFKEGSVSDFSYHSSKF